VRIQNNDGAIIRLKATLLGIDPPIWRRFLVPADITLQHLHEVLQAVMGWTDSHLHQFESNGIYYGISDPSLGVHRVSESKTMLIEVLRHPKDQLVYDYDFGDGWEHEIVLEGVLPQGNDVIVPIVEAGECACPPEDVGGIPGYIDFLEALADPRHPAHREMLKWVGGSFDPDYFDVGEVNRVLRGLDPKGAGGSAKSR